MHVSLLEEIPVLLSQADEARRQSLGASQTLSNLRRADTPHARSCRNSITPGHGIYHAMVRVRLS